MKKKIRELTGTELNAAVLMALGRPVVCLRDPIDNTPRLVELKNKLLEPTWTSTTTIPRFSQDPNLVIELQQKHLICVDAGDGSYKKARRWAAWLASNAPVHAEEEITAADIGTAVARAYAISVLGEEVDLPEVQS